MAASLIGGLVANGTPPGTIWVSDPDTPKLDDLTRRFGVNASGDNGVVALRCATLVLAVKPQIMHTVVQALAPVLGEHEPLLVSIAAGVREADINRWAGGDMAIVRTMPNTPALVGCGATALFANAKGRPRPARARRRDPGSGGHHHLGGRRGTARCGHRVVRERSRLLLPAHGDHAGDRGSDGPRRGFGPAPYLADRARRRPHRERERRAARGAAREGDLAGAAPPSGRWSPCARAASTRWWRTASTGRGGGRSSSGMRSGNEGGGR